MAGIGRDVRRLRLLQPRMTRPLDSTLITHPIFKITQTVATAANRHFGADRAFVGRGRLNRGRILVTSDLSAGLVPAHGKLHRFDRVGERNDLDFEKPDTAWPGRRSERGTGPFCPVEGPGA
jgi:hypothetical protein